MRKLLTWVLVGAIATLGAPISVFAQAPSKQMAIISGELVDAGGRALASQRVELVQNGDVIQSTTSGSRGEWSFSNVGSGEYVARTMINGKIAGVRVMVVPGETMTHAVIVAPSAAAPSAAFLAPLGVLGATVVVAAVVAAVIITVIKVTGS